MRISTPASSNVLRYFWMKRLMKAGDMIWMRFFNESRDEFCRRPLFEFDA
jgi:hypothetical protein